MFLSDDDLEYTEKPGRAMEFPYVFPYDGPPGYVEELAEEFNQFAETIVADRARNGMECNHDGVLIHIHTPWAVGALPDAKA